MTYLERTRYADAQSWWKRHSLSLVLAAILAVQTVHALWAGHLAWLADGRTHGQPVTGWPTDFWVWWSWEYNVSLVADTYGVILIVLLSKWFREQKSAESN